MRKFPRPRYLFSLVWLLCLFVIAAPGTAYSLDEVTTVFTAEGEYLTSGVVVIQVPVYLVNRIITDYRHYNRWALKGLDGKDPVSEKFIGILRDVRSVSPDRIEVCYDVNLPWPFGMKNKTVEFLTRGSIYSGSDYKKMTFSMAESSAAIESSRLSFEVIGDDSVSEIIFEFRLRFTPFINNFFKLKGYKKNIEWRIVKVMENLTAYAGEKY